MIFDHAKRIGQYRGMSAGFDRAIDFIGCGHDFLSEADDRWRCPAGERFRYKVTAFAEGLSLPASQYDYEYHRHHADIHLLLSGRERIALADLSRLSLKADYDGEADFGFANGEQKGWIELNPGEFMICFPNDAHRPWLGKGPFCKALFKVAL